MNSGRCIFSTAKGTFDLTFPSQLYFVEPYTSWSYAISPCTDLVPGSINFNLCGAVSPAPVLQVTRGECIRLGTTETRSVSAIDTDALGVSVSFYNGDNGRRTTLRLTCASKATEISSVVSQRHEDGSQDYIFTSSGFSGCPVECKRNQFDEAICNGPLNGVCSLTKGRPICICNDGFFGPACSAIVTDISSLSLTSLFIIGVFFCAYLLSARRFKTTMEVKSKHFLITGLISVAIIVGSNIFLEGAVSQPKEPRQVFSGNGVHTTEFIYSDISAAAAACAFTPHHTHRPLVPFFIGNAAATAVASNMLASIFALRRPFCVLVIPADKVALAQWELKRTRDVNPNWKLLRDEATLLRGLSPLQSGFRQQSYNRLTLLKWWFALRLLREGYDAFILDPDLVFLRDPIAYFETWAPSNCSIVSATESGQPWVHNAIAVTGVVGEQIGFPDKLHKVAVWNTGQTYLTAGKALESAIEEFIGWAESSMIAGNERDDQFYFHQYMGNFYTPRPDSIGNALADSVLIGEGVLLSRNDRRATILRALGSEDAPRFEFDEAKPNDILPASRDLCLFPLHNKFFLSQIEWGKRVHFDTMMTPCTIHYNYITTLGEKESKMRANGHWFDTS